MIPLGMYETVIEQKRRFFWSEKKLKVCSVAHQLRLVRVVEKATEEGVSGERKLD